MPPQPSPKIQKCVILATSLAGVYDVNRSAILPENDYDLIKEWAESIQKQGLQGIVFHNHFSAATCAKYQNRHLIFRQVAYHHDFNPNVYRYALYQKFLTQYSNDLEAVFVTDIGDVVVLNNPFVDNFFLSNPQAIFCGDESKTLQNEWMQAHSTHLRTQITDFAEYEEQFKESPLLNCGIIGGRFTIMQDFISKLWLIHQTYNLHNSTAYTGDMGAFNYLIRTQFSQNILHGAPINTVFKAYQSERKDCWFRHK